jgi:ABC-type multidrug transport system fused ATPase/permease subunit
VDSVTEDKILAIVKEEFKQNTIVMIAHRLDLIRDSDIVVVLESGRILKSGLPEEVL